MAQFQETSDPGFVQDATGRMVPRDSVDPQDIAPLYATQQPTGASAAAGAPVADRGGLDAIQGKLDAVRGVLGQLSSSSRSTSLASAQATSSSNNAELGALGAARSGGGSAAIDANAGKGADVALAGGTARANETDADKRLRIDAANAAGQLGLKQAGLEFKLSADNLGAATSYLNNLFAENRIKMNLNEDQTARVTNYLKARSALDYDYAALSAQQRLDADKLLTQRFAIDANASEALYKLEQNDRFNVTGALTGLAQAGLSAGIKALGTGADPNIASGQAVGQASGQAGAVAGNQNFSAGSAGNYNPGNTGGAGGVY